MWLPVNIWTWFLCELKCFFYEKQLILVQLNYIPISKGKYVFSISFVISEVLLQSVLIERLIQLKKNNIK